MKIFGNLKFFEGATEKASINSSGSVSSLGNATAAQAASINMANAALGATYYNVGFRPKAIIMMGVAQGTVAAFWQMWSGTDNTHAGISRTDPGNMWTTGALDIYVSGGRYWGDVTSVDATGFTITWNKTSSPTGTLYFNYIAFS